MPNKQLNINGSITFRDYVGWMIGEIVLQLAKKPFTVSPIVISFESDKYPYNYNGILLVIKSLKRIGFSTKLPSYRMNSSDDDNTSSSFKYLYSFELRIEDFPL